MSVSDVTSVSAGQSKTENSKWKATAFLQIGGASGDVAVNGIPLSTQTWVTIATNSRTEYVNSSISDLQVVFREACKCL